MRRELPVAAAFRLREDFPERCMGEIMDRECFGGLADIRAEHWLYWFERREDDVLGLCCSEGVHRHCIMTGDGSLCERGLARLLRERIFEATDWREESLLPAPREHEPGVVVVHHARYGLAVLRSFARTWADIRRDRRAWSATQRVFFARLDRAA